MTETRYYATGKRKTSIARCWLIPDGSGKILVNKRKIGDYFNRETDYNLAVQALVITQNVDKFDIMINVHGGGTSGQAGAIRHGVARALLDFNKNLRQILKKGKFLTRDSRKKERKKYGQPGARARFQYSKR